MFAYYYYHYYLFGKNKENHWIQNKSTFGKESHGCREKKKELNSVTVTPKVSFSNPCDFTEIVQYNGEVFVSVCNEQ